MVPSKMLGKPGFFIVGLLGFRESPATPKKPLIYELLISYA